MTTSPRGLLFAVLFAISACGGAQRESRPDGIDVSQYPPEIQDAYHVFEYRCSRCHSLARPLNADIRDVAFWDDYVERMRRQPGSGINRADARLILKFLVYYTEHRDSSGGPGMRRVVLRGRP